MIISFRSKDTERTWNQDSAKKIPLEVQKVGLRKLVMLNRSFDLNDLKIPPANRLEKLKGSREGVLQMGKGQCL